MSVRLPLMLLVVVSACMVSEGPAAAHAPYPFHMPIVIQGDHEFTPENGVSEGSGSIHEPYVIQGWTIVYAGHPEDGGAVVLKDTRAHVVIRDLTISTLVPNDQGLAASVMLENATNATIIGNELISPNRGVLLYRSSQIEVLNNRMEGSPKNGLIGFSYFAVSALESADFTIHNNTISDFDASISVGSSRNFSILQNYMEKGPSWGTVTISESEEAVIQGNLISAGATDAVLLTRSKDVVVEHNTVLGAGGAGLYVEGGRGIDANNNTFYRTARAIDMWGGTRDSQIRCNVFEDSRSAGWVQDVDVDISYNLWSNASTPLWVWPGRAVQNNSFIDAGIERAADFGSVDARWNWWGSTTGPDAGQVSTGVEYDPWLSEPSGGC